MLNLIYPQNLQKMFTNRERELKLLEFLKKELKNNKQMRLSFFGLRRIGKSLVLKEFLKRNLHEKKVKVCYLNFEEFVTNPEDFALNYVGRICFWFFGDKIENFTSIEGLLVNTPEKIKNDMFLLATMLKEEKINRTALLNFIFSFPSLLAEKTDLKVILLLDEFQKILELENFRDCKNIVDIFRSKIEADNIAYVICGSAITLMHNIVADNKSPLFNQFKEETIENFDRISARELTGKIIKCDNSLKDFIYIITSGHPFYINAIATRMKMLNEMFDLNINKALVKRAFVIELLSKKGDIYKHCEYVYDISLERARYSNSLKSVLKIIAGNEGLNQSQLARKLRVTQGAARTYLNSLINVDILFEKDKKYFFKDKMLRYWLGYREYGIEINEFSKEKILNDLIKDLEEKYLKAKTELGIAKEYEVREKLKDMFGIDFKQYRKGNIEFDAVGCKKGINYIVEVKHRNRETDYKEVEKFVNKVEKSEFTKTKLFFIGTFTEHAKKLAKENKIEIIEV